MKKRNSVAAIVAGTLALTLTACGGSAPSGDAAANTEGAKQEPFEISMILKTNSAEFWQLIQAGAEAYEKEHPDLVKLSIKGTTGRNLLR